MHPVTLKSCPACGNSISYKAFMPTDDTFKRFSHLSQKRYDGLMDSWPQTLSLEVQGCADCGHLWHLDQPDGDSLGAMYDIRSQKKRPAKSVSIDPIVLTELRRLRRFLGKIEKPKFLDFGAGFGKWSETAVQVGFETVAYDPSKKRSEVAQQNGRQNIPILTSTEELDGHSFDVINLEQVMEHVSDPLQMLEFLTTLLVPGGVIRVTVPNIVPLSQSPGFWPSFPFDGHSHPLSPYEHLHGFTPMSLRRLLKRAGFAEVPIGETVRFLPKYAARRAISAVLASFAETYVIIRQTEPQH